MAEGPPGLSEDDGRKRSRFNLAKGARWLVVLSGFIYALAALVDAIAKVLE